MKRTEKKRKETNRIESKRNENKQTTTTTTTTTEADGVHVTLWKPSINYDLESLLTDPDMDNILGMSRE